MKLVVGMRCRNELALLPWRLANLRYASEIVIADQESDDGSWEYLLTAAQEDTRIKPISVPFDGWFASQASHLHTLFQAISSCNPDWIQYSDMDDFPNVQLQVEIVSWLSNFEKPPKRLGIGMHYLYLAPGWTNYYTEPSSNQIVWLWNYLPSISGSDYERPLYHMELPEIFVDAPSEWYISHWDWSCVNRFEKKLERYKGSPASHGFPPWRPEEKFHQVAPVPKMITWYGLNGETVSPADMRKIPL